MASGIQVTNISGNPVTIAGQVIASNGSYTFAAGIAPTVCSDIQLRAGFLAGSISINVSGNSLSNTTDGSEDLLDQIVNGEVTVT